MVENEAKEESKEQPLKKEEVVKKIEENEKKEDAKHVKISRDFKWGTDELTNQVKVSLDRVRAEKLRSETEIYEAIKRFEWKTGIKVVKLDFEMSREKFNPKVRMVLERI
ncbi:MAG: hypothetical protein PHP08_00470 [Candidatus Dojkabacteria bacterium]|nr:hypothetical protein [Candidatus Dojkabacteria bacterium]